MQILSQRISQEDFELYKQVAEELGMKLEITAKEGEECSPLPPRTSDKRVPKGCIYIELGAPQGIHQFDSFFERLNELRKVI